MEQTGLEKCGICFDDDVPSRSMFCIDRHPPPPPGARAGASARPSSRARLP